VVSKKPRQPREPPQIAADGPWHAQLPPECECVLLRIAGRGDVAGEVALVGQQVDDLRSRGGFEIIGPGQRRAVVRGGLPVCAECSRLPRGRYREALHRVVVGGTDRMMHEACEDARPIGARGQSGQHGSMQLLHAEKRQRLEDGEPRQLVPEAQRPAVEAQKSHVHRGKERLSGRRHVGAHDVDLGSRRHYGDKVHHLSRFGRQRRASRQDRLSHAGRHGVAVGAKQLRHEERVPVRERKHGSSIVGVTRDTRHGFDRQRLKLEAKRRSRGELAEQAVQGVIGAHFVRAPRHDDQRADAADAPADVAQQVERRLVCPVHVLEDDAGRRPSSRDGGGEGRENLMPGNGRGNQRLDVAAKLWREVEQRTKRPRCAERFARPP
jgi:hypothetical protein